MAALDNSDIVERFVPSEPDGDTFIYTEMLHRGQKKGNNGHRLVKTFYHRSVEEFRSQLPVIRMLCDQTLARACTRLAPRSYERVGRVFTRLVVDTAMSNNWAGMKGLYNRACGTTSPNQKLWLWDVDDPADPSTDRLRRFLSAYDNLVAEVPSKKGLHFICRPFDVRLWEGAMRERGIDVTHVDLHKDNPTNLYIPDGAD